MNVCKTEKKFNVSKVVEDFKNIFLFIAGFVSIVAVYVVTLTSIHALNNPVGVDNITLIKALMFDKMLMTVNETLVVNTFSMFGYEVWVLNSLLWFTVGLLVSMLGLMAYVVKGIICERYVTKEG